MQRNSCAYETYILALVHFRCKCNNNNIRSRANLAQTVSAGLFLLSKATQRGRQAHFPSGRFPDSICCPIEISERARDEIDLHMRATRRLAVADMHRKAELVPS